MARRGELALTEVYAQALGWLATAEEVAAALAGLTVDAAVLSNIGSAAVPGVGQEEVEGWLDQGAQLIL